MSRIPINAEPTTSLDVLIPQYARQKEDFDDLKKEVEKSNALIKDLMYKANADTYEAGVYTAKRTESTRESMDEAKLLEVMKKYGLTACIQTVEVVDMETLERYLYDNGASPELAEDIDKCRKITPVVTLRVSRAKRKKEDDE